MTKEQLPDDNGIIKKQNTQYDITTANEENSQDKDEDREVVQGEFTSESDMETPLSNDQEYALQLTEAQAQSAEYLDGWQRARAELANYKKRTDKEREMLGAQMRGDVILKLLPVLDDFDLAMANLPDDISTNDWVNGLTLIHRKLQVMISDLGISEILAEGQPFNPNLHEAVMMREDAEAQSDIVIEVMRKGYTLNDRVLRPAMVIIAA